MTKTATLLFAHGGGFCKETWEPIMRRLRESPLLQGGVSTKFVNFDFPYHGSKRDDSVAAKVDLSNPAAPRVEHPARDLTTWTSAEVLRQVRLLKDNGQANAPLIGIGHSMGSSALWNVEVQHPGTFDGLILFEPVYGDMNIDPITDFLVSLTLQRESSWPSREAAEEHLHNLKNFAAWDRESLTAYMKGALMEEPSGKVELACSLPIEASLYCHKLLFFNEQQLAQPKCKIYFHSGARTKMFLPPMFEAMAEKWPHLYTVGEPIPRCSHAMVMEKPEVVSEKILGNLDELEPFRSTPTSPSDQLRPAIRSGPHLPRALCQHGGYAETALDVRDGLVTCESSELEAIRAWGCRGYPSSQPLTATTWPSFNRYDCCNWQTELIHHAIERLLARKRANWEDANILTLGYRQATPEASGHRVAQSNGIMCFYPNTLVASLKRPQWESLHHLMGDDLMIHLLLHYTIFVQLPHARRSYMQIAGKSLRYSLGPSFCGSSNGPKQLTSHSLDATAKGENVISINQVLYSRRFQKNRIFANSHVLAQASKQGELISRVGASRVLRSIFPDVANQKRLPKRLINLIPIVQSMVARFKACNIEELADKLVPVPSEFRKFMSDNPNVKRIVAERTAKPGRLSQSLIPAMVSKALDDGYLSQNEVVVSSSDRKRKRREEAIETLSHASAISGTEAPDETVNRQNKRRKGGEEGSDDASTSGGAENLAKLQQHKEEIKQLLAFTTPKTKIYRLVRKLVARIIPKDIWGVSGTKKNWKCIKQLLRKFVFSRKFDVFSLKKCAETMQVTTVEWMKSHAEVTFCPPNERVKRHKLFADLLWWLLSLLVFPLLRNLFFITEAEGMANEIIYYQRPVWSVLSTLALDDLNGGILRPSDGQVLPSDRERQLTTSRLRLLPKANGIRPLMNLSSSVGQATASVNRSLETVHRVLNFEMDRQPKRLIGAAVRNVDEIYKRLKPLFRKIASCSMCAERRRSSGETEAPMAYCVTVDIERCFDTIRPRKLYQVLKKAIREDEYLIRKHWVGQQGSAASSSRGSDKSSSFFFEMERPAFSSGDLQGFEDLAAQSKKRNAMFIDGVLYDYLTKTKALQLLKEHLFANAVQIEGQEYVQTRGIPQGSVLSTTLCNIYYAHFERRVLRKRLPEVCNPSIAPLSCCQHEELLRYTDDFLYVTTDLKRARTFSEMMHRGNEEYGCSVNLTKSQVNFDTDTGSDTAGQPAIARFDAPDASGCLSWCGMLIDPVNLQIYVNYDKLSSALLQASIPFNETKAAQSFFVNKVVSPIRQRWHPLYFDPDLLAVDTIQVNLFQMLCLAAHRFTILLEMLPFVNHDMKFFHESVHEILAKTTKGIHRSLRLGLETDAQQEPKSTPKKRHDQSSKEAYRALKLQVWTVGQYAFQLMIQTKLDQGKKATPAQSRPPCQSTDWQKLLNGVAADRKDLKQRSKKVDATIELEWLLQDRRNESTIKQCLQLASGGS